MSRTYYKLHRSILELPISQTAKLVLAALDFDVNTITQATLAGRLGMSRRSLQTTLDQLAADRHLDISMEPGMANEYVNLHAASGQHFRLDKQVAAAKVTPTAKLLHAVLTYYAGLDKGAHPKQTTLADIVGASVKTVKRAAKELKDNDLLEVVRGNRSKHLSNRYAPLRPATMPTLNSVRPCTMFDNNVEQPETVKPRKPSKATKLRLVDYAKPVDDVTIDEDGPLAVLMAERAPWMAGDHADGQFEPTTFIEAFKAFCLLTGQPVNTRWINEDDYMRDIEQTPSEVMVRLLIMHRAANDDNASLKVSWKSPYKAAENWDTIMRHTDKYAYDHHWDNDMWGSVEWHYRLFYAFQAMESFREAVQEDPHTWTVAIEQGLTDHGYGHTLDGAMSNAYGAHWLHTLQSDANEPIVSTGGHTHEETEEKAGDISRTAGHGTGTPEAAGAAGKGRTRQASLALLP